MPFVKLDTGILKSTIWFDRDLRDIFITALLMAEPWELRDPLPQLKVDALDETGFVVPPGWYGFVETAGIGIIDRAKVPTESGYEALRKLGDIDPESRTADFDGRRLVRVNGGYVVLNYMKYRDRDYTNAERQARWRERQKAKPSNGAVIASPRYITQAEAEAEAEAEVQAEAKAEGERRAATPPAPSFGKVLQQLWNDGTPAPTFPRCVAITKTREEKCRLRLRERPVEEWAAAIRRLSASSFCRAQNDRGWVATFDWLIANPDNVVKVLEGKYDDRAAVLPNRGKTAGNMEAARRFLEGAHRDA